MAGLLAWLVRGSVVWGAVLRNLRFLFGILKDNPLTPLRLRRQKHGFALLLVVGPVLSSEGFGLHPGPLLCKLRGRSRAVLANSPGSIRDYSC